MHWTKLNSSSGNLCAVNTPIGIHVFIEALIVMAIVIVTSALGAATIYGWLGSRVVSVLDSGSERPGFKSQLRCCRVTVLGKLFTPIVPLFTKQRNW